MIAQIRTFFYDLIESVNTVTLDDFPERFALIMESLRDPRGNPEVFWIGIGIATIVTLIIIVAAVLLYLLLTKDKTDALYYVARNREGEVIGAVPVEDAERLMQHRRKPAGEQAGARQELTGVDDEHASALDTAIDDRHHVEHRQGRRLNAKRARAALSFLLTCCGVVIMLAAVGLSTQPRVVCMSCHSDEYHESTELDGAHQKISCVRCHEPGGPVQSATLNSFARLSHFGKGLFPRDRVGLNHYGVVTSQSCLNCHVEDVSQSIVTDASGRIRMSHLEPLEAGMSCLLCHDLNKSQHAGRPDQGMEICLKCHNGERAFSTCTSCHGVSPLASLKASSKNARYTSDLLSRQKPRTKCYDCHDPEPCDACHGTRIPHSTEFMSMDMDGHPALTRGLNTTSCFVCHDGSSKAGASDCYDCHDPGTL